MRETLFDVWRHTTPVVGETLTQAPRALYFTPSLAAMHACAETPCREAATRFTQNRSGRATHGDLGRQELPAPRTTIMPASWRVFDGAARFWVLNDEPMTCVLSAGAATATREKRGAHAAVAHTKQRGQNRRSCFQGITCKRVRRRAANFVPVCKQCVRKGSTSAHACWACLEARALCYQRCDNKTPRRCLATRPVRRRCTREQTTTPAADAPEFSSSPAWLFSKSV